jgi:hypothetical protein
LRQRPKLHGEIRDSHGQVSTQHSEACSFISGEAKPSRSEKTG